MAEVGSQPPGGLQREARWVGGRAPRRRLPLGPVTPHSSRSPPRAGDSLTDHRNHSFSTKDRDNDESPSSCAAQFQGAWWYHTCHSFNLNGRYLGGLHASYANGINWKSWVRSKYSHRVSGTKLRPPAARTPTGFAPSPASAWPPRAPPPLCLRL